MKKIKLENLKEKLETSNENIFLYLGGHHFTQNSDIDAKTKVKEIDFSTSCFWVWEDTEFDEDNPALGYEAYLQGPLLVKLQNIGGQSPLLKQFLEKWAFEQKGIVLTSTYSAEELSEHLKSLIWMQGESQAEERYSMNLQNPEFQTPWLESFSAKKMEQFMGPISTINWLEICGYEMQWYEQHNDNPALNTKQVGWLVFDKEQITAFRKLEQGFLERELISYISHHYPNKTKDEISQRAQLTMLQAKQKGVEDYKSTVLMLNAQLYFNRNKQEQESTIDLLANREMPLDIRVELAEQKLKQTKNIAV